MKFILATTEPQKIPATILSRCQRFDFKRISNTDIIKRLKIVCEESKIEISEEALNLIAVLAEGGMRDALSILERCNQDGEDKIDENKIRDLVGIPQITYVKQIVEAITNYDTTSTLEIAEEILKQGKDINNLLWEIIKYVKDILLYKATNKAETYNAQEIEDIKKLSEKVTKQELINLVCNLSELENKIKMSTQKIIIFQTGLIKICNKQEIKDITKTDQEKSEQEKQIKNENKDINNLEARVAKIENFLKASNFAEKGKELKYSINETTNSMATKKISIQEKPKPKYEGKTQDYWPKLVNDLKEEGKMFMYINLAGTIAKEINDMTVAIEFPNGMNSAAKDFLERPENKLKIKNIISIASGKEMQIKYIDTKPNKNDMQEGSFEKYANNSNIPFNII